MAISILSPVRVSAAHVLFCKEVELYIEDKEEGMRRRSFVKLSKVGTAADDLAEGRRRVGAILAVRVR